MNATLICGKAPHGQRSAGDGEQKTNIETRIETSGSRSGISSHDVGYLWEAWVTGYSLESSIVRIEPISELGLPMAGFIKV